MRDQLDKFRQRRNERTPPAPSGEVRRALDVSTWQPIPKPASKYRVGRWIDTLRQLSRIISSIKKMKKSSWKTTLGGALMALGQFIPQFLPADYHWLSGTLTGIGGVILGASARDNNVTSEQAGVKSPLSR